jgi:signal transduction histidine kinase
MWRIVAAASVCAVLLLAGAGGLVLWAASAVDRIQVAKETDLVARRLERLSGALVDDVHSATIWNDAVTAVEARDIEWLQVNFGDYYADYMDHEVTLVHDGAGALLLASRESEPVDASDVAGIRAATAGMLDAVMTESRTAARRGAVAFDAAASRSGVVSVDGKAWLVAVSTVVPEDDGTARPEADAVVVSLKPLSAVVESLGADLKLQGAAFATADPSGAAVAVLGPDGGLLGWLTWIPDRPGTAVVREAAPWLIALLLVLIAAAAALLIWLRRTGARLSSSEAALIEARDRAEAASEAKSRFLANMSHELRTPLNGVVAMGEILAQGELSPVQRERLDVMRASGQDLLKMIEHLLQVTRLERGQVLIERADYDPAAVARIVARRHEAGATAKGLALTVDLPDAGTRSGDGNHVSQVLDYLLDNAVTYTPRGEVRLALSADGDRLRYEISDTGPGIPADLLPRVFDVFMRGDDSLTSASGGAGLGLSICRNLVEAMGGRIDVHSAPGEGTRFVVDLPAPASRPAPKSLAA